MKCQSGEKDELSKLFDFDKNGLVTFQFDCLKKLVECAKSAFASDEVQTKTKHRKYYAGAFDVSDADEMAYLIVTEIFYAVPDDNKCISVCDIKSELPIVDGQSLIRNIYFFLEKLYNIREASNCRAMTESELDRNIEEDSDISLIDALLSKEQLQTHGEISRNRICAGVIRLLQEDINKVFDLFNTDSTNVRAVIKTFLGRKDTFYYGSGFLDRISDKKLCDLIRQYTGVYIHEKNIAQCVRTIKIKLLNHLFLLTEKHKYIFCMDDAEVFELCLEYSDWKHLVDELDLHMDFVMKWKKQFDNGSDEVKFINGNIDELKKTPDEVAKNITEKIIGQYLERESEKITELTAGYKIDDRLSGSKMKYWNIYINQEYADFYESFKNKKIYIPNEMRVAIGNLQYSEIKQKFPEKIVESISEGVPINYVWDYLKKEFPSFFHDKVKDKDDPKMLKIFNVWEKAKQEMETNKIKLTFYSRESVKHPVDIRLDLKNITIYEGLTQYILCNTESTVAYVLPKSKRKRIKINRRK